MLGFAAVKFVALVLRFAIVDRLRIGAVLEVGIAVERVEQQDQVLDRVLDADPQGGGEPSRR